MIMKVSRTRSHTALAEDLRISIARLSRRLRALNAAHPAELGRPAGPGDSPGGFQLTITQHAALAAVEQNRSMTPRELAEYEKVQPPSMTRVIAALEAQGLLRRSPHPTDGRQVVLSVTDAGREHLRRGRRRKEAWLSLRLAELSPEEREILSRAAPILDKLSKA